MIQTSPIRATGQPDDEAFDDLGRRFVLVLGRALHIYGAPAHMLEETLDLAARRLDVRGQFFSTPTSLFAGFGIPPDQRVILLRVEPGEVNLRKLTALGNVLSGVTDDPDSIRAGIAEIDAIVAERPRPGPLVAIPANAAVAASAALLLGGGWNESAVAGVIGLGAGTLAHVMLRHRRLARIFELIAGALAMAISVLAAHWIQPLSIHTAALAGLIVLLPGLTLTVAVSELASRHLASGTARLMGALMILFSLGFGVAIGLRAAAWLPPAETSLAVPARVPDWMIVVVLLPTAWGLTALFRARWRDFGPILLATVTGFAVSRAVTAAAGPEVGSTAGAFVLALGSNLLSRARRVPAMTTLLPGLIMLVPGSIGFRGIASMMSADVTGGTQAVFTMLMVAMSIVAGLFFASVLVPARQVL